MSARRFLRVGVVVVLAGIMAAPAARHASAEEALGGVAIGFVDLQRVFSGSIKGREAAGEMKAHFEAKQHELDEESRVAQELQLEINKKSSLWNDETREKKEEEYRRLVRDLKRHAEDVKQELNQEMERVWKKLLREIAIIIDQLGEERGYSMIFTWAPVPASMLYGEEATEKEEPSTMILINNPGMSPVMVYANKSIDVTDEIVRRYDATAGQAGGGAASGEEP